MDRLTPRVLKTECLLLAFVLSFTGPALAQLVPIQPSQQQDSQSRQLQLSGGVGGTQTTTPPPPAGTDLPATVPGAATTPGPTPQISPGPTGTENPSAGATDTAAAQAELDPRELLKLQITQRLEQLTADTESAAEEKETIGKIYQQALVDLGLAEQARIQRQNWTQRTEAAPTALENAKQRRESSKEPPSNGLLFLSVEEGEARLRQLDAELATATGERTKLSEQITNREKRRKELPQLISDAKSKLEALGQTVVAPTNEDALLQEANNWSLAASRISLQEQIAALESEQRAYDAEATLLPLQLELAQAQEKRLQDRVRAVNEELSRIRQDRIRSQRSAMHELLKQLPEPLVEQGQTFLDRIDDWMEISKKRTQIQEEIESSRAVLDRWKDQRAKMDSRVNPQEGLGDVSGFNSWVGLMLRKQRSELPDTGELTARLRYLQSEMQKADSQRFDIEGALADIRTRQELTDSGDEENQSLNSKLLNRSAEILEGMLLDVGAYLTDLYQIADIKEQTRELSEQYRDFIDRNVLWIRSSERLRVSDIKPGMEAFRWLVSYENWLRVGQLLLKDLKEQPWWYGLFGIGFAILLYNQASMRRRIGQLGSKAEKKNCVAFSLTARSLLLTVLVSIPVSTILFFLYWRITESSSYDFSLDNKSDFPKALGKSLLVAALVFFPVELLRQICRIDGLAIKHFAWPQAAARKLSVNMRWLIDLAVPLIMVIAVFASQSDTRWESSLGRLAFMLLMPMLSVFFARVFLPSSGLLSSYLKENEGGWLDRLKYVWYAALVAAPLVLMVVSYIGYHYTAQRVAMHVNSTIWSIVVLTLAYCLATRWLVLSRRKIMIAQARQRLEDAAKRETQNNPLLETEVPELNLVQLNEQTTRLVTSSVVAAGLLLAYVIWSDILPAIRFLEEARLWPVPGDAEGETVWITLANVVLVIPIIVLVWIAGRNLPGLLEIVFLQHLPLTNAARYAITTITRYAIVAIGISVAAATLGLRWQSIQWLIAALGVGLGFGLQEIFANFVSGIILLFEQPIRVGDIITIDGTTGSVLKIRMRATTICNWDRQELIVPNKDLITGKLLNWTLSDSTNRIVINVGVAYGSNVTNACQLVREVCENHENLMKDPPPIVTFEGFGDNTLNLVVRAYLSSLDNRLQTIHELHERIYFTFIENQIEIAFPQRDLHLRSLPDSLNRWLGDNTRKP